MAVIALTCLVHQANSVDLKVRFGRYIRHSISHVECRGKFVRKNRRSGDIWGS